MDARMFCVVARVLLNVLCGCQGIAKVFCVVAMALLRCFVWLPGCC